MNSKYSFWVNEHEWPEYVHKRSDFLELVSLTESSMCIEAGCCEYVRRSCVLHVYDERHCDYTNETATPIPSNFDRGIKN